MNDLMAGSEYGTFRRQRTSRRHPGGIGSPSTLRSHEISIGRKVEINGQLRQPFIADFPDFGYVLAHLFALGIHIYITDDCAGIATLYNHLFYFYFVHSFQERDKGLNDRRSPLGFKSM
jgi:hypothetical protein